MDELPTNIDPMTLFSFLNFEKMGVTLHQVESLRQAASDPNSPDYDKARSFLNDLLDATLNGGTLSAPFMGKEQSIDRLAQHATGTITALAQMREELNT